MPDVLTIREAVKRAKADGLSISEYTLRSWIRSGAVPVRKVGQKALLFYPNLVAYLHCDNGADNQLISSEVALGIRRIEL